MKILILGASSNIGSALAHIFAPKNELILVGRSLERLAIAAALCEEAGAAQVRSIDVDLGTGIERLLQVIAGQQIELVIDVASASSNKRDSAIGIEEMGPLIAADFTSRIKLFEYLSRTQDSQPAVIFISTVLTLVKSPGRVVYTALKGLAETYLRKLCESRPESHLLIVYVGTVIDPKGDTGKPTKLAAAVAEAFRRKRTRLLYGLSGRFLLGLFYLQPVVFDLFTKVQRKIRGLFTRPA